MSFRNQNKVIISIICVMLATLNCGIAKYNYFSLNKGKNFTNAFNFETFSCGLDISYNDSLNVKNKSLHKYFNI